MMSPMGRKKMRPGHGNKPKAMRGGYMNHSCLRMNFGISYEQDGAIGEASIKGDLERALRYKNPNLLGH